MVQKTIIYQPGSEFIKIVVQYDNADDILVCFLIFFLYDFE